MMLLLNQRPLGDTADVPDTYRELAERHRCFTHLSHSYLSAQAVPTAVCNAVFSRQLSLLHV